MRYTADAAPTNADKIRLLPWSVASNAANTVYVQYTFFGSAFVLFLNQLELNNAQIGLLLSFFPFFGLIALFIAPTVARHGYKRTYLTFFAARKVITAFLLLTPLVVVRSGPTVTLYYIMAIVICVALCRAISETALIPWAQEFIPNSIRGKYSATNSIVSNVTGVVVTSIGGVVIGASAGLNRFIILIGIGVLAGFVSVWAASFRPGGAPLQGAQASSASIGDLRNGLQDRNLRNYLVAVGLVTLATVPMLSFVPVFMENVVGLAEGTIVWLQTATLLGGLATTYLWGWAADRYGGKPVMLSAIFARLLLPIGWLLMPINSVLSLPVALAIAVLQGATTIGWAIGSGRLLYVSVVPPEKKNEYMALYYAAIGLFGGISQILGGWLLELFADLSGSFLALQLNPHVPLYLLGLILPFISLFLFRGVRADSHFSLGEFASIVLRGNSLLALATMPRYYWAKDEEATISMTARLGQSQSRLTVEELLDALNDPRFNVRFEAIIAIARMPSDPRLIRALRAIVEGTELSLTVVAAWALGRIGDEHALKSLRDGLNSEYRSIRAHSARALGSLGDAQIVPLLLERLEAEQDKGLQMAYASALGKLGATAATGRLLQNLRTTRNPGARLELALCLARLIGEEANFVSLVRRIRTDLGTAAAQVLRTVAGNMPTELEHHEPLKNILLESSQAFAHNASEDGYALLRQALLLTPLAEGPPEAQLVLDACAAGLQSFGTDHLEYLLLALHTLHVSWQRTSK